MEDAPLTIRDRLTRAYSRGLFDQRLLDEVDRVRRYGTSLALLVFDLDHFKSINDAFGHVRGDEVLRDVVQRVQGVLRGSDSLFRYGGDEFCILLPNTPRHDAVCAADRVAGAVASEPFAGDPILSVSISIGLGICPEDAASPRALFEVADQRSFLAKCQGRGSVVAYGSMLPTAQPVQESSRLIDRDESLRRMHRFLDGLASLRRGVLRIAGPCGSGRSRFLAETMAAARLRNLQVIHLKGSVPAKLRAYGVWLEGVAQDLPSPEGGVSELADALEAAGAASKKTGIFVAADDIADFDFASFQLLTQLLEHSAIRSLGVAYTSDCRGHRSLAPIMLALHELVELGPLSREATLVWLRTAIQWEPPAEFVEWAHRISDGLPGRLHELLVRLREQGLLRQVTQREWKLDPAYVVMPRAKPTETGTQLVRRHLPEPMTDFVGREAEQASVNALLDRSRIVTLVGPGGIGKTRLALEIARVRAVDFVDGVRFVDLGSTRDTGLVLPTIAQVLGVREIAARSLADVLKASLVDKNLLLVLDNFEQVVEAAPLISGLVAGAPALHVLVTSREPLRVSGERVFPVPPLPLPDEAADPSGELTRFAAIALFVLRAQAISYDFTLTRGNAELVVELCTRLDGLPLAIEIMAACLDRMTLDEMLKEERGSYLRATGARDLPARHRTLYHAIEFSHDLLDPMEQALFAALSVFVRGATLDAIAYVCAADHPGRDLGNVVTSLVRKSLVCESGTDQGSPRYGMLDTIRSYALERLQASGGGEAHQRRHATYFLGVAERLHASLLGTNQLVVLVEFDREHGNFQAALESTHALTPRDSAHLGLLLAPFWERRGYWTEGRTWLHELGSSGELEGSERVRCLLWSGRLARLQSDKEYVSEQLGAARHLAEEARDEAALAMSLHELGAAALRIDGNYAEAEFLLKESLAAFRKLGQVPDVAEALTGLGLVAYNQGRFLEADQYCGDALELARDLGDARLSATAMNVLGLTARARAEYAQASAQFEENLSICEWLDDKYGMMDALLTLAELARSRREFGQASALYQRRIGLCREFGDIAGIARCVQDLGEIARYSGRYDEADELFRRAIQLFEQCGQLADLVWVLRDQAELAMQRRDRETARRLFTKSLGYYREHTHPMLVLLTLAGLASIAVLDGHATRAARILGAAESLFESNRALLALDDCADYSRRREETRECLGTPQFESETAAGRSLSLEQAIRLALAAEGQDSAVLS